ncbi:hypothetical protein UFOVP1_12 [uncultured Caudovirales phage]|uniref:Uncharacterized protein n=1 Tax=uncultured Caudovirales phage TaxID=2100421 RepID=A0A6J5KH69_9CAUD|nr:hypothetical protein UFOVP1_12 [uncultured Caudovirales phage]
MKDFIQWLNDIKGTADYESNSNNLFDIKKHNVNCKILICCKCGVIGCISYRGHIYCQDCYVNGDIDI